MAVSAGQGIGTQRITSEQARRPSGMSLPINRLPAWAKAATLQRRLCPFNGLASAAAVPSRPSPPILALPVALSYHTPSGTARPTERTRSSWNLFTGDVPSRRLHTCGRP